MPFVLFSISGMLFLKNCCLVYTLLVFSCRNLQNIHFNDHNWLKTTLVDTYTWNGGKIPQHDTRPGSIVRPLLLIAPGVVSSCPKRWTVTRCLYRGHHGGCLASYHSTSPHHLPGHRDYSSGVCCFRGQRCGAVGSWRSACAGDCRNFTKS